MAQSVKCLPHKHEDRSSIPSTKCQIGHHELVIPSTPEVEVGGFLGLLTASLAELLSSQSQEKRTAPEERLQSEADLYTRVHTRAHTGMHAHT